MITKYIANISGSQLVVTGEGILEGIYVTATSSGTMKLIDGVAAGGSIMVNTFTPAAGYHNIGSARFFNGIYVEKGGTSIDATFFVRQEDR